jgi:hypothetical protein
VEELAEELVDYKMEVAEELADYKMEEMDYHMAKDYH